MLLYCKLKMVLLNLQLPKSKIFPGKRGERKKVEKGEETHTNRCPVQIQVKSFLFYFRLIHISIKNLIIIQIR